MNQTCGRPSCERKSSLYTKRKDAHQREIYYCCTSCAGADLDRRLYSTKLDPMEKSLPAVRGEVSPATSHSGYMIKSDPKTQNVSPIKREPQRSDIMQTQLNLESDQTKVEHATSNEFSGVIVSDPSKQIEPLDHTPRLEVSVPSLDVVKLDSMSIVEESIQSMHGLILCVKANIEKKLKTAQYPHVEPGQVNAAVNCAREMANLMKLKIQISKDLGVRK